MLGLVRAQVTSHDPPWGVRVSFRTTGQQISYRCQMGMDYASALTAQQKPLPQIGSWGLVALVDADLRNAVWICAYLPSQQDALTTTMASGSAATDPHIDYQAHFSGDWWMLDGSGNYSHQWVDGSALTIASGTALPKVYRHTVDASGTQQTIEFTRADRIAKPPTPNIYNFKHVTGTVLQVDVSGSVTVSGSSGATLSVTFGKTLMTWDVSGNVTVSGAAGATLVEKFGGTTFSVDASGLTSLVLPGSETFNISQGGSAADALVLVSKMVTKFNAHTHGGIQSGSSNSSTPTSPIASGDIQSTIVKIQS